MTLSKFWSSANENVQSVGIAAMNGVAASGGAFRSLYTAPPGMQTAATRAASAPMEEHDPIEQARIDAFTLGFDEGCRITGESMAAGADAQERLIEALATLAPAPSGMLSTMLSATVVRLVEQIVGEVEIDIERLLQRCDTVSAYIEDNEGKGALHLHPDDMTMLDGVPLAVRLVPDPAMPRGCVRLETSDGWVEDGPDVRLARLRALLDDMEGKP